MAIISRASARSASSSARVYVETWRSAYAGMLPERALIDMSEQRQAAHWTWIIRQRAEVEPVFVASEIGEGVVGFVSLGRCRAAAAPAGGPFALDGRLGEVFTLYVHPDFQERGVGRQLLAAAFAGLGRLGCARALLWVVRDNASRFFYERMGGRPVAERSERLWGADVAQICYGWADPVGAAQRIGSCSAG